MTKSFQIPVVHFKLCERDGRDFYALFQLNSSTWHRNKQYNYIIKSYPHGDFSLIHDFDGTAVIHDPAEFFS